MSYLTVLKIFAALLAIALLGLVGFAFLGDLSPRQADVVEPFLINAD